MIIVPDASVVLKWLLPTEDEPYFEAALALRQQIETSAVDHFLAPALLFFEVGNTLGRLVPDHAGLLLNSCFDLIRQYPVPGDYLDTALSLTRRYPVQFYDATYHALALSVGGEMVTADQRYLKAVDGHAGIIAIQDWLG